MTNQIEEFYKIEYKIEEFSNEFTFKFEDTKAVRKFSLPKINKLIPVNFEIFKTDNSTENPINIKNPILLKTSKILKCWYLKDTLFETPKVFYGITFFKYGKPSK